MHLVRKVIEVCKLANPLHLNHAAAKSAGPDADLLVNRLPELIRTTFMSATSTLNQVGNPAMANWLYCSHEIPH